MTFLKCSIGGVKYGDVTPDVKEKMQTVSTGETNPVNRSTSQEGNTSPVSASGLLSEFSIGWSREGEGRGEGVQGMASREGGEVEGRERNRENYM